MDPVIRTHTKEHMSATKEREQKDTMGKETDCNTMKPNQQGDSWSNIPSCNVWMKLVLQNQRPYIAFRVIAIYFLPTVTELALPG